MTEFYEENMPDWKIKKLEVLARAREVARQNRLKATADKKAAHKKEVDERKVQRKTKPVKEEESEDLLPEEAPEVKEELPAPDEQPIKTPEVKEEKKVKKAVAPKVIIEEEESEEPEEPNVIVIRRKAKNRKKQQQVIYIDDEEEAEEPEVQRPSRTRRPADYSGVAISQRDFSKYFTMR